MVPAQDGQRECVIATGRHGRASLPPFSRRHRVGTRLAHRVGRGTRHLLSLVTSCFPNGAGAVVSRETRPGGMLPLD
jgi:hypothetical protein